MLTRSRPPALDPVAGASALVVRVALMILLIGALIASVATRQAVYTIVPVGAALTLVGWLLEPDMRGPRKLQHAAMTPEGLGALFLLGWAALSLLWTPFAIGPTERFVKTVATTGLVAVAAAFLPERTKTSNLYLLPIGAMAGAVALVAAIVLRWDPPTPPGELTVLDRAALGLSLVFWPGVAGLLIRNKRGFAIALAALTVAGIVAVGTPVAMVAFVISGTVWLLARGRALILARGSGLVWAMLLVFSPLIALALSVLFEPTSLPAVMDRAIIWGDIVAKDGLRTIIGHGFDSAARAVAAGYLPYTSNRSAFFELWFELGIVGVGAAAFVVARLFALAGAASGPVAPLLLGGLTNALVISGFSVGVSPIWWVTFLALDALAFALVLRGQFKGRRPSVRDIATRIPAARLPGLRP